MKWRAVISALDDYEAFRSRVSVYLHPLAGQPVLWHIVTALLEVTPPPDEIRVLHRAGAPVQLREAPGTLTTEPVQAGEETVALRAAVTRPGLTLLVDGAAPLLTAGTLLRLLRAGEHGVAMVAETNDRVNGVAVSGEGLALASAEDPRYPVGASRVVPSSELELLRVSDRHSLSDVSTALRDRLVRRHEAGGVTFLLPATVWVDADVRIGPDTIIYPGVVLEGATEIGSECVIGPYSRVVESLIGKGAELTGWNYVVRTAVRNQAVLEPYVRRGLD